MSTDRTNIVTVVIEPLAERLEAASKAAYPAGEVSSFNRRATGQGKSRKCRITMPNSETAFAQLRY